jgi:hypothetical protein
MFWAMLGATLLIAADAAAVAPTARYEVTFEGNWSAATHPTDYPSAAHFSPLVGALHDANVVFWEAGGLASPGLQAVAETGQTTPLDLEIDDAIAAGDASQSIFGPAVTGTGTETLNFTATTSHSQLTLVSMVAPSPDWFVGVGGLNLMQDGDWVNQLVIDLFTWDAGTDSGVTFLAPDLMTMPLH